MLAYAANLAAAVMILDLGRDAIRQAVEIGPAPGPERNVSGLAAEIAALAPLAEGLMQSDPDPLAVEVVLSKARDLIDRLALAGLI